MLICCHKVDLTILRQLNSPLYPSNYPDKGEMQLLYHNLLKLFEILWHTLLGFYLLFQKSLGLKNYLSAFLRCFRYVRASQIALNTCVLENTSHL